MLRSGIIWSFVKMIMLRSGNLGLKMGVSPAAHTQYAGADPIAGAQKIMSTQRMHTPSGKREVPF